MAAIARMDALIRNTPDTEAAVQLECALCPKRPTFSDSSHLLTHVSSKAHLHQKFSMEFKAKSDVAAREKLELYEKWYKRNEIERLLSERMSSKAKGRSLARRSRVPAAPRKSRARKSTSTVESIRTDVDVIAGCHTPTSLPQLTHWNTAPVIRGDFSSLRESAYLTGALYDTPMPIKHHSSYQYPDNVSGGEFVINRDPFGPYSVQATATPSEGGSAFGTSFNDEDFLQANKLKGVVWPGMDIFDSATPDQKRRRNQRKDDAALDLLKITSENVTATETVWGPEGNIRKERDIYASPSSIDGTPPSTPPLRKRKSRARNSTLLAPLATLRTEGSEGDLLNAKGASRPHVAHETLSKSRSARATTRATGVEDKTKDSNSTASIEDAVYALASHNQRSTFNVYYEGNANTVVDPQTALAEGHHRNSFDQSAAFHARPALQQLDPNLSMADNSPYFKHSTSSSHFFGSGNHSPPTSYRSTQQASYATGYQGMSSNTLNPLCSQPRTGGSIYPQFENPMFSGHTGNTNDGNTTSFNDADTRRIGYSNFVNCSPFDYNDQRDSNIREGSYTDPNFQSTGRLFEL